MEVTIKVTTKLLKDAIEYRLENDLYENYSDEHIKLAKIPTKAAMTKQLMADEKFINQLTKEVASRIAYNFDDYVYDSISDVECKIIDELEAQVALAYDLAQAEAKRLAQERSDQAVAAAEEKQVQLMIKALEKSGYKIVKAWQPIAFSV